MPHELKVLKVLSFLKDMLLKEGRKKTPSILLRYPERVLMVGHTTRDGWKEGRTCMLASFEGINTALMTPKSALDVSL